MSDRKQGEAGSGDHTPRKGEQPPAKPHRHDDTGQHGKAEEKVHHETAKDAKGTGKYTAGA